MRSTRKMPDPEVQAYHRDLLRSVEQMKAGKAARKTRVKVPAVVSARISSGLTQAQFAELLGISVRTLQKWEQGARDLRVQPIASSVLRSGIQKSLLMR